MNSSIGRTCTLLLRWGSYTVLLLLAAVLETIPGFMNLFEIKPLFILPLALAVSVHEDELNAAFFGTACGLVWDWTAARYAGGFALELAAVCLLISLLTRVFLQIGLFNFCLITAGCCLVVCSLDFVFNFIMVGYGHIARRYFFYILPMVFYSAAISPLEFLTINAVSKYFSLE